jgi:hypothetical protein
MKRIILTESQYKRLVRKRLDEQNIRFESGKGWDDYEITGNIYNYLVMLLDSVWANFEENVYVKSIEGDKVTIDLEKYGDNDEIKDHIVDILSGRIGGTGNPDDKDDNLGKIDFTFDTGPLEDEEPERNVNLITNYGDDTMGFKTGGPDSGLAMVGGTGGNWNGSMPRALAIAKMIQKEFNVSPYSQKRYRKETVKGKTSEHYYKNFGAYAVDLPTGKVKPKSSKDKKGDKMFNMIVELLGKPNTKSGKWQNINYGGYRYQIGWRVSDHYNHVHVGVKKN